ncbi:hypothetical protein [Seonamhaeicola sp.]|uniref:hypothetical protein n=1 Tax=Seonamhaeicola sp. TaxID=1912245 RepID=UPI0026161A76|nr:hypothetical protein [Seonamhaeicola sp.]
MDVIERLKPQNSKTVNNQKNMIRKLKLVTMVLPTIVLFLMASCGKGQLAKQSEYIEHRHVIFNVEEGYELSPGDTLVTKVNLAQQEHKMKRNIRVTGFTVLPKQFGRRGENRFREYCQLVDDYLDGQDTYKDDSYSLVYLGENEAFEKNAYYRLTYDKLKPFKGKKVQVNFPVKRAIKGFGSKGFLKLRLQLYKKKQGRALDDIFDDADDIWELEVPAETSDWEVLSKDFVVPEDIACILVEIVSLDMSGTCKVGAPWFEGKHGGLDFYKFQPYVKDKDHDNWIGANLSSKEWPEFEFALNGKPFYTGKVFDRASEVGEFDINLPEELPAGEYKLSVHLLDREIPASFPFMLKAIEVHKNSARDFEVVYVPEYVVKNEKFGILIEVNKQDIELSISGDKQITPVLEEKIFVETGLHALVFEAGDSSLNQIISISNGTNEVVSAVGQIVSKKKDGVYLSTGDDIYIGRTKEQWSKYLKWHMREGMGNLYCWRPSHQWSGARDADPEFYKWATGILQDLQMPYPLMMEGRTIAGKNVNPSMEVMDSSFFLGRQSHEDDGSFYYWDQFVWEGLYSDLAAKFRPYGGIFAKARPIKRPELEVPCIYYDFYGANNMEEGAQQFVNNLRESRGQNTRHTGPSTMFRYFFQAGYEWVGAEQMYGPEELIMSSLRGASKAYGTNDFGTHLATQWGSQPFNATDHARRFFLSLAISYIHGATNINTEEGVWNMEEGIDRYTDAGKAHMKAQKDLLDYILTHERRGTPVASVGVLQGRNDGWKSFDFRHQSNTWGQKNSDQWKYGAPEASFDMIKTFYPNSELGEITLRAHEPRLPKGYYTATPYGLVDLLPIEAPQNVLDSYESIAFLGWNTFDEKEFEQLLAFVKKGGTLLLTGNHANTELRRDKPTKYPQDDKVLVELLGKDYKNKKAAYRRNVGKGEVIFYPQKLYPAEAPIKDSYNNDLKQLCENSIVNQLPKGWIESAENIGFAAWDWEDSKTRTIYVLNIDWWTENIAHPATLRIGDAKFPIDVRRDVIETVIISQDMAVIPQNMTTDVLNISKTETGYDVTIQTTGKDTIKTYHAKNGTQSYELGHAGIHKIKVE